MILVSRRGYALLFFLSLTLVASGCVMTVSASYVYSSTETPVGSPNFTVGVPIQVVAYTNDPTVSYVIVEWVEPGTPFGPIAFTDTVTTSTFSSPYYYFSAPDHAPTVAGNWYFFIDFYNSNGKCLFADDEDCGVVVQPTCTPTPSPVKPVPEFPVLGTAGAIVICLLATMLYVRRVKARELKQKL